MSTTKKQKIISDYEIGELVGKGSYGAVFIAKNKATGDLVAIKKVDKKSTEGLNCSMMRQISFLIKYQHPHIIKLLGYNLIERPNDCFLFFQYVPKDLHFHINENGPLNLSLIKNIVQQVLSAIDFCHRQGFMHRDVKPQNILFDPHTQIAKLADFGLVRQCFQPHRDLSVDIASLFYQSPELLLRHNNYNNTIDIWSVGCVFAELVLGKPLFYVTDSSELIQTQKICKIMGISIKENLESEIKINGKQNPIEQQIPELKRIGELGLDLLNKMLKINQQDRIEASEALSHEFFK